MWPTLVWSLACIIMVSNPFSTRHNSLTDAHMVTPTSISDTEYEQVIAERYLFAPSANESTTWPVLTDVHSVWQVVSLPQYHYQAAEGVWLLTQMITNSAIRNLQISWMSLAANGTLIAVHEIEVKSRTSILVVSHNDETALDYTAALISLDCVQLILCDQSDATACRIIKTFSFPSILANTSKITAGLFAHDITETWLYIAADTGLHGLDLSRSTIVPFLNQINVSVSSLAWTSKHQVLFAGTETKLWIYSNNTIDVAGWRFEHINALIDAPITSLVYNEMQDKLWIGQDTGITLLSPIVMSKGEVHWFFSRLAGQISNPGSEIGHLPFGNITTLSVSHSTLSDSRIWLGANRGVMRFDSNHTSMNAWRVFNSARYMPNRDSLVNVSSLAVVSRASNAPATLGSAAVAVTTKGLAVLRFEMWTLAQKAEHFQAFFNQSGRHDKYNLVSDCKMSLWGDSRTCVKEPRSNDGLWTSIYLGSQIFRYVVTKDIAFKTSAWIHFEALEILNKVTGISGYPGRSFAKRSDFPPRPDWYLSPVYSTLQFKGDTSSDEIAGHQFVYPLVHDLLASNDDERQRAYALLLNITTHILTHDWYLVGENDTHTTWGIWNPIYVNNDSDFQDDRGLNSLEILAFLLQSYAYSSDERFLDGIELLIESYQYHINLINQKMIAVCESNFSDDELAYLSYFSLVHAINTITSSTSLLTMQKTRAQLITDKVVKYMKIGLDLSHKYKQMEKSPFYNLIYCYASGQVNETRHLFIKGDASSFGFDCNSLTNDAVWYMQRWPLELIDWPQFNSDRLDIQLNKPAYCSRTLQRSLQMLPPDERSTHKWSSNVYNLDDGNGFVEEDPSSFLISYWGMRYFNLIR